MKKSGARHVGREYALRVLYGHEIQRKAGVDPLPPTPNWWSAEDNLSVMRDAEHFAKALYQGVEAEQEQIDEILTRHSKNWRLARMSYIDRNILRLSVYELRHHKDTAASIILDEAVEMAKCYGTQESARFINGILDSVVKELQTNQT
jgi:N utilization substance protein B